MRDYLKLSLASGPKKSIIYWKWVCFLALVSLVCFTAFPKTSPAGMYEELLWQIILGNKANTPTPPPGSMGPPGQKGWCSVTVTPDKGKVGETVLIRVQAGNDQIGSVVTLSAHDDQLAYREPLQDRVLKRSWTVPEGVPTQVRIIAQLYDYDKYYVSAASCCTIFRMEDIAPKVSLYGFSQLVTGLTKTKAWYNAVFFGTPPMQYVFSVDGEKVSEATISEDDSYVCHSVGVDILFDTAGTYKVRVDVEDAYGHAYAEKVVTVLPSGRPSIRLTSQSSKLAPTEWGEWCVNWSGEADSYKLTASFGDGETEFEENMLSEGEWCFRHAYTDWGYKTATFTVSDKQGASRSVSTVVRVTGCPVGSEECGEGCMPEGSVCCEDGYCSAGDECCGDGCCGLHEFCWNGVCCPDGSHGCDGKKYCCLADYECCETGEGCCPIGKCCGTGCCDEGDKCCLDAFCCPKDWECTPSGCKNPYCSPPDCCSNKPFACGKLLCMPAGADCCGDGTHWCGAGTDCCGTIYCMPEGSTCCGSYFCRNLENGVCCPNGGCCPQGDTCCGTTGCCPPGTVCCPSGETCCLDPSHCCGNHCCEEGVCCGSGCCDPGKYCCPNQEHCCPLGTTCTDDGCTY